MAGERPSVQRDAGPGDPLHVGHRCATVDVGSVPPLFGDDGKDPQRRQMPRHAGGNRRLRDWTILAVEGDLLRSGDDDNMERSIYDRPLMPRYAFVLLRLTIRFVSVRLGRMPPHGAQIFDGRLLQTTTTKSPAAGAADANKRASPAASAG